MAFCLPVAHPFDQLAILPPHRPVFGTLRRASKPVPLVQLVAEAMARCLGAYAVSDLFSLPPELLARVCFCLDFYGLAALDRRLAAAGGRCPVDLAVVWRRLYTAHRSSFPPMEPGEECWRDTVIRRHVRQALRYATDYCLQAPAGTCCALGDVQLPRRALLDDELPAAIRRDPPLIPLADVLRCFAADVPELRIAHRLLLEDHAVEALEALTHVRRLALVGLGGVPHVANALRLLRRAGGPVDTLTLQCPTVEPDALEPLLACSCANADLGFRRAAQQPPADLDALWELPPPATTPADFDLYGDLAGGDGCSSSPSSTAPPAANCLCDADGPAAAIPPPGEGGPPWPPPGSVGAAPPASRLDPPPSCRPGPSQTGVAAAHLSTRGGGAALPRRPCLTALNLFSVQLSGPAVEALAAALRHCPALRSLSLVTCALPNAHPRPGETEADALAVNATLGHAIGSAYHLTALRLQSALPEPLVDALCRAWTVGSPGPDGRLDLSANPYPAPRVERLRLGGSAGPCPPPAPLLATLRAGDFARLRDLDLAGNPLDPPSVALLAELLDAGAPLTALNISGCTAAPGEALPVLAAAARHSALQSLRAAQNVLGPTASPVLADLLRADHLTDLDLSRAALGPTALTPAVLAALEANTSLRTLSLATNRLEDVGGVSLAACIGRKLRRTPAVTARCEGYPVLLPTPQARLRAAVSPPRNVVGCSLTSLDVSSNRLTAISGFAFCCALAGQEVTEHAALVERRQRESAAGADPRHNEFPEWNAELAPRAWLPVASLPPPAVADVCERWGECSAHFRLALHTLHLEGNHLGRHEAAILSWLAARCRCVRFHMALVAVDHEP